MIESGFRSAKGARRAHLEHETGLFNIFGVNDRSTDFQMYLREARSTEWFNINPTSNDPRIDEPFTCTFNAERLDRSAEIEERRKEMIAVMVEAFADTVIDDGVEDGPSYEFAMRDAFDRLKLPRGTIAVVRTFRPEIVEMRNGPPRRDYG